MFLCFLIFFSELKTPTVNRGNGAAPTFFLINANCFKTGASNIPTKTKGPKWLLGVLRFGSWKKIFFLPLFQKGIGRKFFKTQKSSKRLNMIFKIDFKKGGGNSLRPPRTLPILSRIIKVILKNQPLRHQKGVFEYCTIGGRGQNSFFPRIL